VLQRSVLLGTHESRDVGQKFGSGESTGHESGRIIVDILDKETPDLDGVDHEQMKRTVSYVHRHLAQHPDGDVTGTRWRHSLMNWGHAPLGD